MNPYRGADVPEVSDLFTMQPHFSPLSVEFLLHLKHDLECDNLWFSILTRERGETIHMYSQEPTDTRLVTAEVLELYLKQRDYRERVVVKHG